MRAKVGEPFKFLSAAMLNDTQECIVWPFAKNNKGYGLILFDGVTKTTHKLVALAKLNPQPTSEHQVAHSCNVRLCINYKHLRWATNQENQNDRFIHGTNRAGENSPSAKYNWAIVNQIRDLYSKGFRKIDIEKQLNVPRHLVADVIDDRRWKINPK